MGYVRSYEHDEVLHELRQICHDEDWVLAVWSVTAGLRMVLPDGTLHSMVTQEPVTALAPGTWAQFRTRADQNVVTVLLNFHQPLQQHPVIQAVSDSITLGKRQGNFLVILSAVTRIPPELERHLVLIDHPLPDRGQLAAVAEGIVADEPGLLPQGAALQLLTEAASGLTTMEAENAFSLSIVEKEGLLPQEIWKYKEQLLRKTGYMRLNQGGETFDQLKGLDAMKDFCLRMLRPKTKNPLCRARGLLLLGASGAGKSSFVNALGNSVQSPAPMGSLVGQSLHGDQEIYFCSSDGSHVERTTVREAYESGCLGFTYSCTDRGGFLRSKVLQVVRHVRHERFVRVRTQRGLEILVTEGHSLFCRASVAQRAEFITGPSGWKRATALHAQTARRLGAGRLIAVRAGDLRIGQRIATVLKIGSPKRRYCKVDIGDSRIDVTEAMSQLAGLWIANGSLNKDYLRISSNVASPEVESALHVFGCSVTKYVDPNAVVASKGAVEFTLNSIDLARFAASLGFGVKGQHAHNKRVPAWMFGMPQDIVAAFLRGYFSGDGSFSGHNLEVGTRSNRLAYDVTGLLRRFGMAPYLHEEDKEGKPFYTLTISKTCELLKFHTQIGFLQEYKNSSLRRFLRGNKPRRRVKHRQTYGVLWDKVVAVEDVSSDDQYAYDLSVPGVERFASNWILAHNSSCS